MSELFSKDIEDADSLYKLLREAAEPGSVECRDFAEELWGAYQQYADRNFLEEIARNFHARFWEMYLACSLIQRGLVISRHKPGPDILLEKAGKKTWIEAVTVTAGRPGMPDSIPERHWNGQLYGHMPTDKIILRLSSAISEKFKKYKSYVAQGLIKSQDCYVIALNANAVYPSIEVELPLILKAVFPIGSFSALISPGNPADRDFQYEYRPGVPKASGKIVETDVFLSDEHKGLSAVITSMVNVANHPTNMSDEYMLVHNPNADAALEYGLFKRGMEYSAVRIAVNRWKFDAKDWNSDTK